MERYRGDKAITTKVDETTRNRVDRMAEDVGISRSEAVRRLLGLYHQSEEGNLECPLCSETVQVHIEDMELAAVESDGVLAVSDGHQAESPQSTPDTPIEESNTETSATSSGLQRRVNRLESVVESQQKGLDRLQRKITVQAREIDDFSELGVSPQRIENLEEQVRRSSDVISRVIPRIEALMEVSNLSYEGKCPSCGDELTVEQSVTDLGGPTHVKCKDCGLVVGH